MIQVEEHLAYSMWQKGGGGSIDAQVFTFAPSMAGEQKESVCILDVRFNHLTSVRFAPLYD